MNIAIIVAAGSGTRFGAVRPKQFLEIAGKPLLVHTLERFEHCAEIDEIVPVLASDEIEDFQKTLEKFNFKKIKQIARGGKTRAESVLNALDLLEKNVEIVAVHDGARPLVSVEEIAQTIEKAQITGAACLVGKVTDTIKRVANGKIVETVDRENLRRAQTPQAFRFEVLKRAFAPENFDASATDECFLVEKAGFEIAFTEGSAKNIKITTREDLAAAETFLQQKKMNRIGFGNDIHRLESGKPLILGGVLIESERGAVGHSDSDALAHAVTDAILGALALGDIGSHFSDKDERWRNADSFVFLREAVRLTKEKNFTVVNLDSTISLEKPRLRPFIEKMRENLAVALEVEIGCISVKAKTGEKLDSIGRREAVRAEAVILLSG